MGGRVSARSATRVNPSRGSAAAPMPANAAPSTSHLQHDALRLEGCECIFQDLGRREGSAFRGSTWHTTVGRRSRSPGRGPAHAASPEVQQIGTIGSSGARGSRLGFDRPVGGSRTPTLGVRVRQQAGDPTRRDEDDDSRGQMGMVNVTVARWVSVLVGALLTWNSTADCTLGEEEVLDLTAGNALSYFLRLTDGSALVRSLRQAEVHDVFNVTDRVELGKGESVVKANLVTFSEGGTLHFMNVEAPFWAIVADELRIHGSGDATTGIVRNADYVLERADRGTIGRHGVGESRSRDDHGRPGEKGGDGGDGEAGHSRNLPCLFVIARHVAFPDGTGPQEFTLHLPGIRGGDGGNGGPGGNGAHGQAGNHGDDHWLKCRNEPGDGGRGGDGGTGGDGGRGGRGGNGGSVVFVGDQDDGRLFLSAQLRQEPGEPGSPGKPGSGGKRGEGGDDGSRNGVCQRNASEGPPGNRGKTGNTGESGERGNRGRSQVVSVGETQLDDIMSEVFPLPRTGSH